MKTSIKILLGLVVAIFMIPTIFFMAFGIKVKSNNFKPYDEASMWNRVDVGPARFIKITSPDKEVLDCKLTLSDKPHYMVWANGQGGDDSLNIHQQLDTLFITYVDIHSQQNSRQYQRDLEIFVSDWQQLQIDGASVSIDSSFGNAYPLKHISMVNSILDFGVSDEENDGEKSKKSTGLFMNNVRLESLNSKLVLNNGFGIKNLELAFSGGEMLVQKGASVDTLSGFISTGTQLNVDGAFINKTKGLQIR